MIRSLLWVWANPEMTKPGEHTVASFVEASPLRRAELLGVPNIVMAGNGVPDDDAEAERLTRAVASAPRLVWEISADKTPARDTNDFVYELRMAQVRKLAQYFPQLEGVLLDDLSSLGMDHGFKPAHIRRVRELLGDAHARVKLWGVIYTMNLERPGIADYLHELDVVNLWTWHAKDIPQMEENLARVERLAPGKPIVLGLYLYDYGGNRRMPPDLLRRQCETALKLARAGRIQGIVFLAINNDAEAVGWAANWVKEAGAQRLRD